MMLLKYIYIYIYLYIHNARTKNIEDKIPDITNLANNGFLNVKINEVKCGTPSNYQLSYNCCSYYC